MSNPKWSDLADRTYLNLTDSHTEMDVHVKLGSIVAVAEGDDDGCTIHLEGGHTFEVLEAADDVTDEMNRIIRKSMETSMS